jgi:hypothetical protein
MNKEKDTVGTVERPKRPCGKCITGTQKHGSFVIRKIFIQKTISMSKIIK